ncbi:hypothetical protein JOM56_007959 [Amanita muscaria]
MQLQDENLSIPERPKVVAVAEEGGEEDMQSILVPLAVTPRAVLLHLSTVAGFTEVGGWEIAGAAVRNYELLLTGAPEAGLAVVDNIGGRLAAGGAGNNADVLPYNEAADTAGLAAPNPGRGAEGDGGALEEGTDGESVACRAALKVHLPDWPAIRTYRRNWFERRGSFLCAVYLTPNAASTRDLIAAGHVENEWRKKRPLYHM